MKKNHLCIWPGKSTLKFKFTGIFCQVNLDLLVFNIPVQEFGGLEIAAEINFQLISATMLHV